MLTIGTGDGPGIISDDKLLGLVKTAVSRVFGGVNRRFESVADLGQLSNGLDTEERVH